MKRTLIVISILALTAACGDDSGGSVDSSTTDGPGGADGGPDAMPPPPMPAVGTNQLDRMGRPAINTAVIAVFQSDATMKTASKDAYNHQADQTMWSSFATEIGTNLAVLDAVNDDCGDQPGYVSTGTNNAMAYGPLAALAADDRLYVNTTYETCAFYFGVEAAALDLLGGATAADCGGRVPKVVSPTQDPIDSSYKLLAGGDPLTSTLTDGIAADDKQATVSNTEFPFLAAP